MKSLDDVIRAELTSEAQAVDVSETDLLHARHRYGRRLADERRRRRRRSTLTAAAALTGLVAGGALLAQALLPTDAGAPAASPGSTVDAPLLPVTPDTLRGVWKMDGGGWLWVYGADGSGSVFNPAIPFSTRDADAPYRVIPRGIEQMGCRWDVDIRSTGDMRIRPWADRDCSWYDPTEEEPGGWVHLTRLSPATPGSTVLGWSADPSPDGERRDVGVPELRGSWVKEGSGELLMVVDEGGDLTYSLDDDGDIVTAPDVTGRLELDPPQLVLRSSSGSAVCDPGTTVLLEHPVVWTSHVEGVPSDEAMELTVTGFSGCEQLDELGGTWIRISGARGTGG